MAGMLTQAAAQAPQEDPGKMDFTAKGAAVDSSVAFGAPPDPMRGVMDAREAAPSPGASAKEGAQSASEEEQKEYERALGAVETAMYSNDKVSRSIVDQLQPGDKIGSVVKTSLLFLKQIDAKIDMDEVVIPQILEDIVDRVVDLAERVKNIQFSEKELQAVLGAAWEGTMEMYGTDTDAYQQLTQGMGQKDMDHYASQYKQFLGE